MTAYDDNRRPAELDTTEPVDVLEPLPTAEPNTDTESFLKGVRWVLDKAGSKGIASKVTALRYLFRLESRSMEKVGAEHGVTRAAISKFVTKYGRELGQPTFKSERAKAVLSKAQRRAWAERRAKRNATL